MKKTVVLTVMLVVITTLTACGGNGFVNSVKKGELYNYSGTTIGKAFEDFFADTGWRYFEADTGEDVVEFTGECTLYGKSADARIQFVVDEQEFYICYMQVGNHEFAENAYEDVLDDIYGVDESHNVNNWIEKIN